MILKTNQAKIKKFQQLTDRFRGGLIKAPAYYDGVEELFGSDNVEVKGTPPPPSAFPV